MKLTLTLFIFVFSFFTFYTSSAEAHCSDLYNTVDAYSKLGREIAFTKEMMRLDFQERDSFKNFQKMLQAWKRKQVRQDFRFDDDQLLQIILIGMENDIYCSPWPFGFNEIFSHLQFGHYFDAALNKYIGDNDTIKAKLKLQQTNVNAIPLRSAKLGRDFTHQFFYYLDPETHQVLVQSYHENEQVIENGERVSRPNAPNLNGTGMKAKGLWYLHDRTGGPNQNNMRKGKMFSKHEYPVELQAQAEMVVLVSNKNRVAIYKPFDKEKGKDVGWDTLMGSPTVKELFLPSDRRDWTFSFSATIKPSSRPTQEVMDASVDLNRYYEDRAGQKIDFGFTATLFVLSNDGRKISYWDTGLPGTFARAFLTPRHGSVEGLSISAAGSTILMLGLDEFNQTKLYTYMYDYEMCGGCPGLTHTYDQEKCERMVKVQNGQVMPLRESIRCLPNKDWREHQLPSASQLTSVISIEVTGAGDSQRVLKIEGISLTGEKGYFQKRINDNDNEWQFIPYPSNQHLLGMKLKQHAISEHPVRFPLSKTYDISRITKGLPLHLRNEISRVVLKDFHYYQTEDQPAIITVYLKTGESFSFSLRTSDGYHIYALSKVAPDLVGKIDGPDKVLLGSFVFDQETNVTANPLSEAIYRYFKNYDASKNDEMINHFRIRANDGRVIVESKSNKLSKRASHRLSLVFSRDTSADGYAGWYEHFALHPSLSDIKRPLDVRIAENKELLLTMEYMFWHLRYHNTKQMLTLAGFTVLLNTIEKPLRPKPISSLYHGLDTILYKVPKLFVAHEKNLVHVVLSLKDVRSYLNARRIIKSRLKQYALQQRGLR